MENKHIKIANVSKVERNDREKKEKIKQSENEQKIVRKKKRTFS